MEVFSRMVINYPKIYDVTETSILISVDLTLYFFWDTILYLNAHQETL